MSRELDDIIEKCELQLDLLNKRYTYNCETPEELDSNRSAWWFWYNRYKSALAAKFEQSHMHWTTSGDFSHLQSTPPVSF